MAILATDEFDHDYVVMPVADKDLDVFKELVREVRKHDIEPLGEMLERVVEYQAPVVVGTTTLPWKAIKEILCSSSPLR